MSSITPLNELDCESLKPAGDYVAPDWPAVKASGANAGWALTESDILLAYCSVWLNEMPAYRTYKTAALGHFFAADHASGAAILEHAIDFLRRQGENYLIGPMNGNTWQSYRFVTDSGDRAPFFMEPISPPLWPQIFIRQGFEVIAEYSSALSTQLDYQDDSIDKVEKKIKRLGLVLRPFNLENSERELEAVYRLSVKSFARNFLYTDISQTEFMRLYQKVIPYLVPEFFQLVEHNGKLVAYVFAIPDYAQKLRGEKVDTLILKTVSRSPEKTYAGLGNYLVYRIHQLAIKAGFKNVIHALMHQSNASKTISGKSATTIRRYSLYGREL